MELITLVENSSSQPHLGEEFGLSILVRCQGGSLLFDMGATSLFAENAQSMGIDLGEVHCAVVSHGHYDHGGGLERFFDFNTEAPVYLGAGSDGMFYGNIGAKIYPSLRFLIHPLIKHSQLFSRYIGLDRALLENNCSRTIFVNCETEVLDNVFLLTDIENLSKSPKGNDFLLEKQQSGLVRDSFYHELVMVVREDNGIVVFTGCGHRGIINILQAVQKRFPGELIKGVIGGFHLAMQPGWRSADRYVADIHHIIEALQAGGVQKVITGHCTGDQAYTVLRKHLGSKLDRLTTGFRCSL